MTGGARAAALKALLRVDTGSGYSNIILNNIFKEFNLNHNDKTLTTAIFYGVLERRITLDYVIGRFSKLPPEKVAPAVLEILRIGVYQILYLEKIPDSAAVNECVNLAKECGQRKASGFVNAVLRNLLRNINQIKFPSAEKNPLENLSVKYSCPKWLVSLWIDAYGEPAAVSLLKSMMEKPDIYARVNNTLISEEKLIERLCGEGIKAEAVPWIDGAVKISGAGDISKSGAYKDGLFHIQDLSSQLCCFLLSPRAGETVIDVCSAPGGKAFTIAEIMRNKGRLLAFDKYPAKINLIAGGAKRLRLDIIDTAVRDAANPKEKVEFADRVLCDVPCSGLGVLRRKPEIRYKLESVLDSLPNLQYLILCESSKLVKNGGILFYSTCTLNPKENADVANRFIVENSEFEPVTLQLPETIKHAINEPDNQLTLMPFAHGTDGFFISAFRKTRG